MIKFPNCKINLGLDIVNRRADGYHDIVTVFYPVGLTDVLEIVPAASGCDTTLKCSGRTVACPPEKNLVMKAYRLLQQEFNLPAVDIYLHKNIPDGAGLGGGSSDASSTLMILNKMFDLRLTDDALAQRAATLGADCAFFIYNKPLLATGIGNVFAPASVDLAGSFLMLVKPNVSVPTAEAYSRVKPAPSPVPVCDIVARPVAEWRDVLKNDFEPSVFAAHRELEAIKSQIYSAGAIYASMSGSGSSIFGIFESDTLAEAAKAQFAHFDSYVIKL